MKPRQLFAFRSLPFPVLILAGTIVSQSAQAATYYWDNNGTIAGFGTAGSTWGTDAFWTTDASGVASPSATSTLVDDVNFGSATLALAAGTVGVSGTVSAQSITFGFASGAIALSGGTSITLGGTGKITVNNAADTIGSVINGAADLTKLGTGILTLSAANTYSGATTVHAGQLTVSGVTGTINNSSGVAVSAGATLNLDNSVGSLDRIKDIASLTLSADLYTLFCFVTH